MRHLVTLSDLTSVEIERIFAITEDLKSKYENGLREPLLPGRVMALIFEKPSLRTRVSFEAGMIHLGGGAMFLGEDVGFGKRESLSDFARVLGELVDVVVVRAKRHQTVVDLAAHCTCPVINGLTDLAHPCQAMADLYTLREIFGSLEGRTLAWIGDGNNVARSLATGCGKVGMRFVIAAPEGYEFDADFVETLEEEVPNFELVVTRDPAEAVADACAVYTDVWVSMGQESEVKERQKAFAAYQVHSGLMAKAPSDAVFMHCLPARRGEEVTDEVMDSPASVIVRQAGNRMHAQKGILAWLLGTQRGC